MATDISKLGNAIQVTVDTNPPQSYAGFPIRYFFDAAGTNFNIFFGVQLYTTTLANLRLAGSGTAPASAAAALTGLSTIVGVYP